MKQTAMQELLEEVILEREKSISVEFREALDFVITAIKKDYKEIEKQQRGYSEEDLEKAFHIARLYKGREGEMNFDRFINNLKNK